MESQASFDRQCVDPPSIDQRLGLAQGFDFVSHASDRPFSVAARDFGTVRVARVDGTASSMTRTRRHFADGRNMIALVISGGGQFRVDGVQGVDRYGAGGAAVLESARESKLLALGDTKTWSFCIERAPIEPLLSGVDGSVQRCIGESPALHLLGGYMSAVFAMTQPCDGALVSQHVCDLFLSALGVTGDTQALVRERGVTAARLQVLLDRLSRDAVEPGLDPARLAARMGISVRYLHRLLEPTGRSFSEHLLACRLARAAQMLRDPQLLALRIGDIALRTGFSDLSHFSRSFRRAYGDTPYGWRVRTALRRDRMESR
jgi:AraC-like DNA-binding protein